MSVTKMKLFKYCSIAWSPKKLKETKVWWKDEFIRKEKVRHMVTEKNIINFINSVSTYHLTNLKNVSGRHKVIFFSC